MAEYIDYLNLLKRSLLYYEETGDWRAREKSAELMRQMPNRLEQVKEQTSHLAWKIRDKPELELSDAIMIELNKL